MRGFELARRRLEAGHRLRFYQDFYGRQWVRVQGGWMFWRSKKIDLAGEEVLALKELVRSKRPLLRDEAKHRDTESTGGGTGGGSFKSRAA